MSHKTFLFRQTLEYVLSVIYSLMGNVNVNLSTVGEHSLTELGPSRGSPDNRRSSRSCASRPTLARKGVKDKVNLELKKDLFSEH